MTLGDSSTFAGVVKQWARVAALQGRVSDAPQVVIKDMVLAVLAVPTALQQSSALGVAVEAALCSQAISCSVVMDQARRLSEGATTDAAGEEARVFYTIVRETAASQLAPETTDPEQRIRAALAAGPLAAHAASVRLHASRVTALRAEVSVVTAATGVDMAAVNALLSNKQGIATALSARMSHVDWTNALALEARDGGVLVLGPSPPPSLDLDLTATDSALTDGKQQGGVSTGAIVGIVVGVLVLIAGLVVLLICYRDRRSALPSEVKGANAPHVTAGGRGVDYNSASVLELRVGVDDVELDDVEASVEASIEELAALQKLYTADNKKKQDGATTPPRVRTAAHADTPVLPVTPETPVAMKDDFRVVQ